MNKTEKMRGCVALCALSLNNLKESREAVLLELKTLFKALEIEDHDPEKIKDTELYKIALNLEWNAEQLEGSIKDLASLIEDLEKIKI